MHSCTLLIVLLLSFPWLLHESAWVVSRKCVLFCLFHVVSYVSADFESAWPNCSWRNYAWLPKPFCIELSMSTNKTGDKQPKQAKIEYEFDALLLSRFETWYRLMSNWFNPTNGNWPKDVRVIRFFFSGRNKHPMINFLVVPIWSARKKCTVLSHNFHTGQQWGGIPKVDESKKVEWTGRKKNWWKATNTSP